MPKKKQVKLSDMIRQKDMIEKIVRIIKDESPMDIMVVFARVLFSAVRASVTGRIEAKELWDKMFLMCENLEAAEAFVDACSTIDFESINKHLDNLSELTKSIH